MSDTIHHFEDLKVWQAAHRLTLEVYKITKLFPKEERFGLIDQLRRASVSIQNNIAEGFGRRTTKDYICFLYHSNGSLQEVRCSLRISADLEYFDRQKYQLLTNQLIEIEKMLKSLISSLSKRL